MVDRIIPACLVLVSKMRNMDVDARRGLDGADTERLAADLESGPAAYDPERPPPPPPPPAYGDVAGGVGANGAGGVWSGSAGETVSGVNALYQVCAYG